MGDHVEKVPVQLPTYPCQVCNKRPGTRADPKFPPSAGPQVCDYCWVKLAREYADELSEQSTDLREAADRVEESLP